MNGPDPRGAVEAASLELQGHRSALLAAVHAMANTAEWFIEDLPSNSAIPLDVADLKRRAEILLELADVYSAASIAHARAFAAAVTL